MRGRSHGVRGQESGSRPGAFNLFATFDGNKDVSELVHYSHARANGEGGDIG